jgi:hypothetical protein
VDDLERRVHAGQALKGGAQNLVPLDHVLDGRLQQREVELPLGEHGATRVVRLAPVGLLHFPDPFLLRRKPVSFNRFVLHVSSASPLTTRDALTFLHGDSVRRRTLRPCV